MDKLQKSETYLAKNGKASRIFYVVECSEFHNLGKEYRGLTLKEAVRRYENIYKRMGHMIPGLGLTIEDAENDLYSGCDCELVAGKCLDLATIRLVPYFAEHPVVIDAIAKLRELMPDLTVIGGDGKKDLK